MQDQNFENSKQPEPFDLESRLQAYYGHQLREQPLSQASWQHLQARLGLQQETQRSFRLRWRFHGKRLQAAIPAPVEDAFARIAYDAHIPVTSARLRCSMKPHNYEPAVRATWFGRHAIRLELPLHAITTMEESELDVLLATGLARSVCARTPGYTLGRLLLASMVLLATFVLVVCWMHAVPFVGVPLFLALCISSVWFLHVQARSRAFRADALMVFWLGRERVCNGLHAVADHSRNPRRRRWGEPSLAERILRICGTRIEVKENELTLVR